MHRLASSSCFTHPALCAVALVALGACQGCGTGAYKERMNKRLDELRRGGPSTAGLYGPGPVPGTPFSIRVPEAFKQGRPPGAVVDGKPVKVQRIQPPITIPGLKVTWEGHVDHEGSKLPFYCYLAVSDQNPTGRIQSQLKQQYENVDVTWSDYKDAAGKTWKRWRGDLVQDWLPQDSSGNDMPKRELSGMLEFDCRQEGNQWMIVGWRVPRAIRSTAKLEGVIGATLGSLQRK